MKNNKIIFFFQVASMTYIWIFILGISIWIVNLIWVAYKLDDAFDASLAISIVAIPVFLVLAMILTYVFVGLQKGRKPGDM